MHEDVDARTEEILDQVALIEGRLDPAPVRRGQRTADLLTVAVIAVLALALDWELRYPSLLIAALLGARGIGRLLGSRKRRALQHDRDRLLGSGTE